MTTEVDPLLLVRMVDAAEGKGWRQDGRVNSSLVWREDLQLLLLAYMESRRELENVRRQLFDTTTLEFM